MTDPTPDQATISQSDLSPSSPAAPSAPSISHKLSVDQETLLAGAGAVLGGPAGLVLGLEAKRAAEANNQPVSMLTTFAIGKAVIGIALAVVMLIVFIVIFSTMASHISSGNNLPGTGPFGLTCANSPRPTGDNLHWTCSNGIWSAPAS